MDSGGIGNHDVFVLTRACQALAEATSPIEVKEIRDQAEAFRAYAKSAALSLEIQNQAAEVRLRAERRGGELLSLLCPHGGNRRSKSHADVLKLEEIGFQRIQSHRWRQLAAIRDQVFEKYVRECNDLKREITEAGLLRFAREKPHVHEDASENRERIPSDMTDLHSIASQLSKLVQRGESFACICIYPPWPKFRRVGRTELGHQRDRHLCLELERLPIGELAAHDCHLHIWTTSDRLRDALKLSDRSGFTYRSVLVCQRPTLEYGSFWCSAQDFVVLATKGDREFQDNALESLVHIDVPIIERRHKTIRGLLERVSPSPRVEIFAHGSHAGWLMIRSALE